MTDSKALIEQATRRAAILHASAAWGSDEDGALIDRLLDHIEVLETHNEGYKLALAEQLQIRQQLEADNARLREAGNELGGYAGHDDSCACVKGWATGPCNCGYTDTWNQWTAALQETSQC